MARTGATRKERRNITNQQKITETERKGLKLYFITFERD